MTEMLAIVRSCVAAQYPGPKTLKLAFRRGFNIQKKFKVYLLGS